MVYKYKEILKKYKDDYNIRKALLNKELFRVEKGIYSDSKYANPLIIYSKKYPNAVITMDNAFYYYNLTDVIPNKVYLDTLNNSRAIRNEKVEQYFSNEKILGLGRCIVKIENQEVYMYDKERMLIELIRKRNKISFDYYKEIIASYRDIANELGDNIFIQLLKQQPFKNDTYICLYF